MSLLVDGGSGSGSVDMSIFRSVDRWVIGDGGIVLFVAVIFRKRVFGGMQFLERSVDEMQF